MDSSPSTPPPPYAVHHLGPFLGPVERTGLALIAYPIVALAFVAVRFYFSARSAERFVDDAKEFLVASCFSAQRAATAAVSIPRWMAQTTNEGIQDAVIATIEAARDGLFLILTALENIIFFVIDTYKGFWICVFQLVIQGGMAAIIELVKLVESSFDTMASGLQSAVSGAQSGLNSAIGGINSGLGRIPGFGNRATIPTLNIDTSAISNVSPPDDLSSTLIALNDKIPTADELREMLKEFLSKPFDLLKNELNETLTEKANNFVANPLPLPPVRTVDFCSDVDTSIVDEIGGELADIAQTASHILIGLLVALAVVNAIMEFWRWRSLQKTMVEVQEQYGEREDTDEHGAPVITLSKDNILIIHSQLEQGFTFRFVSFFGRIFKLKPTTRDAWIWFIQYITYPPALMCLLIGVVGIVSVWIQFTLIKPLDEKFANAGDIIIGNFSQKVADEINNAISIDSAAYAAELNAFMDDATVTINDEVFGLAFKASDAINGTVVKFYEDLENDVRRVFDGTLFGDSVVELLRCIIGNKIFALEAGMAWMKENLHMRFPRVQPDVLLLGGDSIAEIASPIATAAGSGGDATGDGNGDQERGILTRALDGYRTVLKGEIYMFSIFLGIYAIVVLSALIILCIRKWISPRFERKHEKEISSSTDEPEKPQATT